METPSAKALAARLGVSERHARRLLASGDVRSLPSEKHRAAAARQTAEQRRKRFTAEVEQLVDSVEALAAQGQTMTPHLCATILTVANADAAARAKDPAAFRPGHFLPEGTFKLWGKLASDTFKVSQRIDDLVELAEQLRDLLEQGDEDPPVNPQDLNVG